MWLERFQLGNVFNVEEIKQYWCTSYAVQRAYEGSGYQYQMFKNLGIGGFPNAKNWFTQTILPKTDKAKVGCIACWSGGEYGHVAYVEDCQNNHIKVSQANSKSTFFISEHDVEVGKPNTELGSDYIFLGFIETPVNDIRVERDTTKLQVEVVADMLRVREKPNGPNVSGLACPKGIYNCEIIDGWVKLEDTSYIMFNEEWMKLYEPDIEEDVKNLTEQVKKINELFAEIEKEISQMEEKWLQTEEEIAKLTEQLKNDEIKLNSIKEIVNA